MSTEPAKETGGALAPAPQPEAKPPAEKKQAKRFDATPAREGTRRTRYLAQSILLEEYGTGGLIRSAIVTIVFVVAAFVVWASITKIEEMAVTFGEVIPAGHIQAIQHFEGGIIREILVEDGKTVDKGDVLLRLDPSSAYAELRQSRVRLASLKLEAERLKAFAEGREPDFSIVSDEYAYLRNDQASVFHIQRDALDSRRVVIENQIEQRRAELESFEKQEENARERIRLLGEEVRMRRELFKKGLQPKLAYLAVQREMNDAQGQLATIQADKRRAGEALQESENRIIELEAGRREETLNALAPIVGEIAELEESITKVEDRVARLEMRAPVHGIVKGLQAHTVGGVIAPGAVVMEIVPIGGALIVETRITTRDVGHVQIGQPVSVKFTSFDYARYGDVPGTLKGVSATTFLDEKEEPYYKGVVTLDRNHVGEDPARNHIIPGMTAQADIRTGEKTLIQYLLKPIYVYSKQAFRER